MNRNTYIKLSGVIFLIIALLHLSRAILGWPAMINGFELPIWISWVAFIITGYLSYQGLSKK